MLDKKYNKKTVSQVKKSFPEMANVKLRKGSRNITTFVDCGILEDSDLPKEIIEQVKCYINGNFNSVLMNTLFNISTEALNGDSYYIDLQIDENYNIIKNDKTLYSVAIVTGYRYAVYNSNYYNALPFKSDSKNWKTSLKVYFNDIEIEED